MWRLSEIPRLIRGLEFCNNRLFPLAFITNVARSLLNWSGQVFIKAAAIEEI